MRMATDKHKFLTLTERDTIVLSSSVIPGNEIAVRNLRIISIERTLRLLTIRDPMFTLQDTATQANLFGYLKQSNLNS